ncbi:MAG: TonB-dependent receptor [Candidatus Brevundimonas colombiensis]|uniref:TonB-dependent receptor n=1 Tax=Candidatus Brevundimonas colombiensis TaxID=3121376 RepID=A0AAJ5X043_9CAUL|nr:TonB-dependent receptor [Brevundimonas sp.]WEK39985.1 MAG: TonB-dependent receptor [Brevundimonas sp.]
MLKNKNRIRALLGATALSLTGGAVVIAMAAPTAAYAQATRTYAIQAQPLSSALQAFAQQSGLQVAVDDNEIAGLRATAVRGAMTPDAALRRLVGQGATYRMAGAVVVVNRRAPSSDTPVARRRVVTPVALTSPQQVNPNATALQDIVVTARRMEERIIDVPVAVSAFTAEQLDERKIEGGSELLRVIPNVNFSKDNFTGYNFSIRGIGAKVLATTADPGVAISFNNTTLLRNRLFEQEYFDVQRLEVLRGPQGTLYGRNATAGVVNMLPNLPKLSDFAMDMQWEVGNHDSRRAKGMINIPIGDTLAVRFAAAATQRDGFDFNTVTDKNVNGRDLWGARLGVLWQPTENFRANFLWERFREEDDRARTGKMLCTRGETPKTLDWRAPDGTAQTSNIFSYWTSTSITPACTPSSLYADEAYGVPDGRGFPLTAAVINFTGVFENPTWTGSGFPPTDWGNSARNGWDGTYLLPLFVDPFGVEGNRQSANLRTISTGYDPKFKAENDVFQMNLEWDLTPSLTLYSQTLYMEDSYSGFQDFFRTYATGQMYRYETPGMVNGLPRTVAPEWAPWIGASSPNVGTVYSMAWSGQGVCGPLPNCGIPSGGIFLDPQLGATDRFMALDLSQAKSTQWSQEFRLQSDWDGPFNFNLGANWLKYKTEENYWVFSNIFSMMAVQQNGDNHVNSGNFDRYCNLTAQGQAGVAGGTLDPHTCAYIDNTPLADIIAGKGGDGHNYIRNISISETESWAVFGEGYWTVRDDLRLTLGLRYTDDAKTITPVPSQLLASTPHLYKPDATGLVGRGYPRYPSEEMHWGEWTGRAAIDWRPDLSFTNDTLIYASYSRGYKGGGGNPRDRDYNPNLVNVAELPSRYDPEFVNAYEIGMKNSLMSGQLVFNATGFFYDYSDYQVAQLMERQIHNENFDARIWGAEFETAWRPTRNFRLDATLGLLRTRIGDGEESVDVMNRTQGNPDWVVLKPWPGSPSTCIVPAEFLGRSIESRDYVVRRGVKTPNMQGSILMRSVCPAREYQGTWIPGSGSKFNYADNFRDPWQAQYPISYDPRKAPNGGRGFSADLPGNELPNAPRWTFNVGAQYRFELPAGWDLMVRGDYYRQSDSWMRVYNLEPYDRLKGWGNANLSVTLSNTAADFVVQAYVKNVFDDTPLTDGFTGPDDMGNATNVFTLDPRIIGASIRKSF